MFNMWVNGDFSNVQYLEKNIAERNTQKSGLIK